MGVVGMTGFPLRYGRIGDPKGVQFKKTQRRSSRHVLLFPTLAQACLAIFVNKKSNAFTLDFLGRDDRI